MRAVIDNWPIGANRTTATFAIEQHPSRGERATRFTISPKTGKPSATKTLTYAVQARIVDGDDGRTYLAMMTMYRHVSIMQSNMQFQAETIHADDLRYGAVAALFNRPGE